MEYSIRKGWTTGWVLILLLLSACAEPPHDEEDHAQAEAAAARARLTANEGGQLVLRAIEAHGGLETWYDTPTSAYHWEYSNEGANLRFKSSLVADNRTRQVYHDLLTVGTPDEVDSVDARFAWDGQDAWMDPAEMTRVNPRFWATTGYYFESIPFVLADPGLRYERLPPDTLDGAAYDLVKVMYEAGVGDSPGDHYILYVSRETGLVDAIRYTVTYGRSGNAGDRPVRETLFYYDDYVTVDGLTVPTHFRGYLFADGQRGAFKNEAWASKISFRQPFEAAKLEAPPGALIAPSPQ